MRNRVGFGLGAIALAVALAACGGADGSGDDQSQENHRNESNYSAEHEEPGARDEPKNQTFRDYGVNAEIPTAERAQSTFALDVDTGSYAIARATLTDGFLPDPDSVRTEEFINYFAQDYEAPARGLGIHVDGSTVPFLEDPDKRVVRVGLQGANVDEVDRRPVNLTVVADVSGSMEGEKLAMVQAGLTRLVDSLRPDDRLAIVTYSTEANVLLPMTALTDSAMIRSVISELTPQAKTNLEAGLRLGYAQAQANLSDETMNRVVLLSDGVANVGETDPHRLAAQIAQEAGDTTQLAAIGVGRDTYNDVILEQFADKGNGFYAFVDTPEEAERLFVDDLTATLQTVALDAKVQVTFDPETVSHYRLLGYENRQLDDDDLRDDTVDGGEIGAGHTVTALYEVTLAEGAELPGAASLATVEARWTEPDTGAPAENSATVTASAIASSFEHAPKRLQQDILVAAFAEVLRGAPWRDRASLGQIASNAELLAAAMPSHSDVADFARLTRTAAEAAG